MPVTAQPTLGLAVSRWEREGLDVAEAELGQETEQLAVAEPPVGYHHDPAALRHQFLQPVAREAGALVGVALLGQLLIPYL